MMDANWIFRPAATSVTFDQVRLPGSASAVAPTVLPAQNTVRPPTESASADDDFDSSARATKGEIVLDHDGHQVIYRVRDAATRRVIWQVPDAATLRLRAYARTADPSAERTTTGKTDIEA